MLTSLAVSLALTLLLELPVAYLWGARRKTLLLAVLVNTLTNPAVVLLHALIPGALAVALLELSAFALEGLCYWRLSELKKPWLLSLAANGFSYGMGLVLNRLF